MKMVMGSDNRFSEFTCRGFLAVVFGVAVFGSALPGGAQSWITNLVDRAARAGEKLERQEKGEEPGTAATEKTPATEKTDEPASSDAEKKDVPAEPAAAAEKKDPGEQSSASAASSEKVSEPASGASSEPTAAASSEPAGQAVLVVAAPEGGVEPEANWSVIRDLLSTELAPAGNSGPILASLTGEKEALATAVPVAVTPEETPAPASAASKPRTSSSSRTQARSTPRPRSQPRQRTTSQRRESAPEPRRSLYNPYSTYSR